jgi:hypothetical protein
MHEFLAKFYEGLLPLPSPFELPPGSSNRILRLTASHLSRFAGNRIIRVTLLLQD